MRVIPIVLALSCIVTCGYSQESHDEASIRSVRSASNRAIAAGDAKAFEASLAPDAVVVTGNGTYLTRDAYIAAFAKDFQDPHSLRFVRTTDSVDLSKVLPLAAEHGHWIGIAPNGTTLLSGTYLAMWRDAATGWQIRSELFVVLNCFSDSACKSYGHKYAGSAQHK